MAKETIKIKVQCDTVEYRRSIVYLIDKYLETIDLPHELKYATRELPPCPTDRRKYMAQMREDGIKTTVIECDTMFDKHLK